MLKGLKSSTTKSSGEYFQPDYPNNLEEDTKNPDGLF